LSFSAQFNHAGKGNARKIFAVDPITLRTIWEFEIAATLVLNSIQSFPTVTGDTLIAFSTYAPDNGVQIGEWSDSTSSLFIIDSHGRLVQRHELGDKYSEVSTALLDIDGDGWEEVIAVLTASRLSPPEPTSIWVWRSNLKPHLQPILTFQGGFRTLIPYDFKLDGKMDLITIMNSSQFAIITFDKTVSITPMGNEIGHKIALFDLVDIQSNGQPWLTVVDPTSKTKEFYDLRFNKIMTVPYDEYPMYIFLRSQFGDPLKSAGFIGEKIFIHTLHRIFNYQLIWALLLLLGCWVVVITLPLYEKIRLLRGIRMYPTAIIGRKGKLVWTSSEWKSTIPDEIPDQMLGELASAYHSHRSTEQTYKAEHEAGFKEYNIVGIPFRNFIFRQCVLLVARDVTDSISDPILKRIIGKARNDVHRMKGQIAALQHRCHSLRTEIDEVDSNTPGDPLQKLDKIDNINVRLFGSCKALLDLLESWQVHRQQVKLNTLIDDTVSSYIQNYSRDNVTFSQDMEDDISVEINTVSITECLENLLDNAVNAMSRGGCIRISGKRYEAHQVGKRSNLVRYHINISDEGDGMTPEMVKLINESGKLAGTGGFGYGIADIKRVMEEHGGNVFYKSELGKETTVTLEFRIAGTGS